ncbi:MULTISPECIES: hypothetical protein [Burkholderia]|uniref:Uncharacterized protein n=1 Tax=Burkholderia anthina TaxID=179879 RepID=A0A7T6VJ75_9BURK|nr:MULTISPECIES: hypothetical protein [Burkholderia]MBY4864922.1 hypothetical protein [Burkholderia anthina]QQK04903.1 hypothetical protein JFN94_26655 [Burkholderia anthina]
MKDVQGRSRKVRAARPRVREAYGNSGITSWDRNGDPWPIPLDVHIAKHIHVEIEEAKAYAESINMNH